MNIPNSITALRFVIIPFFGYYLYKGPEYDFLALGLFLLGGLTDILDGYIARRFNMITSWGKLADPIADKLMQLTALFLLTLQNRIPIIIIIIVIVKEVLMSIGSILIYKNKNHVVSANWYGKAATIIFYIAVVSVIMFDFKEPLSGYIMGIAILPTLFALVMYGFVYHKLKSGDNTEKSTSN